ncbi:MAG: aminotransferase class IV [Aridibacter sp.]
MHKFASFNHEILPANNIKINAISSAGLYGKGIFTTLAIYNSKPFLWEKHWRRLNDNAEKIGIDLSEFNEQKVYNSIEEIIEKNNIKNSRCRITFFDESASKIWQTSDKNKTSLLIQTADSHEIKQNISVTLSPFLINSTSPLAGVKSCNYLENILALENAKKDGFDEAIRINKKNEVVSACMANIFWLEYNKTELFTPSLETGCLAGTIREFLMEKFNVVETKKEINELFRDAEFMFLTSSGINVVQVSDFVKEIKFANELHELTRIIKF